MVIKENVKCAMCGGTTAQIRLNVFRCEYCQHDNVITDVESKEVLSDMEAEVKEHISRARFAISDEYDYRKGLEESENALKIDPSNEVATWSAFLAENHVFWMRNDSGELVASWLYPEEKPITQSKYYSKLSDYYKELAIKLEKEREVVLEEFKKVGKYKVFISYKRKESDGSEIDTLEEKWARALYLDLITDGIVKKGEVFFDQESLQGSNAGWEPHIFSAIKSAKCMILLGSKIGHINSTWVKNEWKRFGIYSKESKDRELIVAADLRTINTRDLPEELTDKKQIVDTNDPRWLNDVKNRIKDVISKKSRLSTDGFLGEANTIKKKSVKKEELVETNLTLHERSRMDIGRDKLLVDIEKDLSTSRRKKAIKNFEEIEKEAIENGTMEGRLYEIRLVIDCKLNSFSEFNKPSNFELIKNPEIFKEMIENPGTIERANAYLELIYHYILNSTYPSLMARLIDLVYKYKYDNKEAIFHEIYSAARTYQDRTLFDTSFNVLKYYLSPDKQEEELISFAEELVSLSNFSYAKDISKRVIEEYNPGSYLAHYLILISKRYKKNINGVFKDPKAYDEELLGEIKETIGCLPKGERIGRMKNWQEYILENDMKSFEVQKFTKFFDDYLALYSEQDQEEALRNTVKKCMSDKAFDLALYYLKYIPMKDTEEDARVYWNMMLCDFHCSNEHELYRIHADIDTNMHYRQALAMADDGSDFAKHISDVRSKQLDSAKSNRAYRTDGVLSKIFHIFVLLVGLLVSGLFAMYFLKIHPFYQMGYHIFSLFSHLIPFIDLSTEIGSYIIPGIVALLDIVFISRTFKKLHGVKSTAYSFIFLLIYLLIPSFALFLSWNNGELKVDLKNFGVKLDVPEDYIATYKLDGTLISLVTLEEDTTIYLDSVRGKKGIRIDDDALKALDKNVSIVFKEENLGVNLDTKAFKNNAYITSISFSSNMNWVNRDILYGCVNVESVSIPVASKSSEDDARLSYIFGDDVTVYGQLKEVKIGTANLGSYFLDIHAPNLKTIDITDCTYIEGYAFTNMGQLDHLIAGGNPIINDYAFEDSKTLVYLDFSSYALNGIAKKYSMDQVSYFLTDSDGTRYENGEKVGVVYVVGEGRYDIITDVLDSSSLLTMPNYIKTGYNLVGYYDNNGVEWNFETNIIEDCIMLTAKWNPITYKACFFEYDGTLIEEKELTYDKAETVIQGRKGYTFNGWAYSEGGKAEIDGMEVKNLSSIENDMVNVYAIYTANKYKVIVEDYIKAECAHTKHGIREFEVEFDSPWPRQLILPTLTGIGITDVLDWRDHSTVYDKNGNCVKDIYDIDSDTELFVNYDYPDEYKGCDAIFDVYDLISIEDGKSYVIMACMENIGSISPIGQYNGTIYGSGHVLSGGSISTSSECSGFIGKLYGTIKDLTFNEWTIENSIYGSNSKCGVIAGLVYGGRVENCIVENSSISGRAYDNNNTDGSNRYSIAGAVVGQVQNATMDNCISRNNDIYCFSKKHDSNWSGGSNEANHVYVGAVVGEVLGSSGIYNCLSDSSNYIKARTEYRSYAIWPITCDTRNRIAIGGICGRSEISLENMNNECKMDSSRFVTEFASWNDGNKSNPVDDKWFGYIVGKVG